jgi:micrococcal nuclease
MRSRVIFGVVLLATVGSVGGPAHAQTPTHVAYVTRVVDGNLIYAALGERIEAVRYIGVTVPLIAHPTRGPEPYAGVVREINQRLVDGKWIRMAFGEQARDRQGHLLAYVWVDDVFVNAALLDWGYAEAEHATVNTRYAAYFQSLEEGARRAGRGLWGYGDVLTYHRVRPAESPYETGNYGDRAADASGGRVFSSPNPIIPTELSGTSASSASPGTVGPLGRSGSSAGYLPTVPPSGWGSVPQPGTTYMPAPRTR